MFTFCFHVPEPGETPREKSRSFLKASLEEGMWQFGSFSVLTEKGLERGAIYVVWLNRFHSQTHCRFSKFNSMTPASEEAEDTGLIYSNLLQGSQAASVL